MAETPATTPETLPNQERTWTFKTKAELIAACDEKKFDVSWCEKEFKHLPDTFSPDLKLKDSAFDALVTRLKQETSIETKKKLLEQTIALSTRGTIEKDAILAELKLRRYSSAQEIQRYLENIDCPYPKDLPEWSLVFTTELLATEAELSQLVVALKGQKDSKVEQTQIIRNWLTNKTQPVVAIAREDVPATPKNMKILSDTEKTAINRQIITLRDQLRYAPQYGTFLRELIEGDLRTLENIAQNTAAVDASKMMSLQKSLEAQVKYLLEKGNEGEIRAYETIIHLVSDPKAQDIILLLENIGAPENASTRSLNTQGLISLLQSKGYTISLDKSGTISITGGDRQRAADLQSAINLGHILTIEDVRSSINESTRNHLDEFLKNAPAGKDTAQYYAEYLAGIFKLNLRDLPRCLDTIPNDPLSAGAKSWLTSYASGGIDKNMSMRAHTDNQTAMLNAVINSPHSPANARVVAELQKPEHQGIVAKKWSEWTETMAKNNPEGAETIRSFMKFGPIVGVLGFLLLGGKAGIPGMSNFWIRLLTITGITVGATAGPELYKGITGSWSVSNGETKEWTSQEKPKPKIAPKPLNHTIDTQNLTESEKTMWNRVQKSPALQQDLNSTNTPLSTYFDFIKNNNLTQKTFWELVYPSDPKVGIFSEENVFIVQNIPNNIDVSILKGILRLYIWSVYKFASLDNWKGARDKYIPLIFNPKTTNEANLKTQKIADRLSDIAQNFRWFAH